MATMVLEEDIADRALEAIGVKAFSQDAGSDERDRAAEMALMVYHRLIGLNLAPFETDDVPEWAQGPVIALVAAECIVPFGVPAERSQVVLALAATAIPRLTEQVAINIPKVRIRPRFY